MWLERKCAFFASKHEYRVDTVVNQKVVFPIQSYFTSLDKESDGHGKTNEKIEIVCLFVCF